MSRINHSLLLLAAAILFSHSCKRGVEPPGTIEADYIQYKVIYLEKMAGDIPTRVLPDVMDAYYSKRYIKTSINGFFGQFALVQVADLRMNTVTTMLNFFGNKVYTTGEKGEIPAGIVPIEQPGVRITGDTVTVCGILSKTVVIETESDTYDIHYIEHIDIRSPNITTPYHFIDYVLSDFRVQLSMLKMQLTMCRHEKTTIGISEFKIPEGYEEVSRETMETIINSLFTKE